MLTRVADVDLRFVPQMERVRQALLEEALKFYQEFLEEQGTDLAVRHETGRAARRVGDIHLLLGQRDQALAALRQAVNLQQALTADFPDVPDYRSELALSQLNLGWLVAPGQPHEAEAVYRQGLDLLQQLAADYPNEPVYRHELARGYNNLGILFRTTRQEESAGAYREAVKLQEELVTEYPEVASYRRALARSYTNAGLRAAGPGPIQGRRRFSPSVRGSS